MSYKIGASRRTRTADTVGFNRVLLPTELPMHCLAPLARFELAASTFAGLRSIQLSYKDIVWDPFISILFPYIRINVQA